MLVDSLKRAASGNLLRISKIPATVLIVIEVYSHTASQFRAKLLTSLHSLMIRIFASTVGVGVGIGLPPDLTCRGSGRVDGTGRSCGFSVDDVRR